jgi:hypothetical protein
MAFGAPRALVNTGGRNDRNRCAGISRGRSGLGDLLHEAVIPLRVLAITSNVSFILYGYWAGIEPVMLLHIVLLPVNAFRLLQALQVRVSSRFPQPWRRQRVGLPAQPVRRDGVYSSGIPALRNPTK